MAKTAIFTDEGNGKVKYVNGSELHYLEAAQNVMQHPTNENYIKIGHDDNRNSSSGFKFDWNTVLTPACASRNELITLLQLDYFRSENDPNTAAILAKLIDNPATESKQDTLFALLNNIISSIGLTVSDVHHTYIHQHLLFSVTHFITNLANGGNFDILITTGSKVVDSEIKLFMEGEAEYLFYEAPTTTAEGTALTKINRDRSSLNTAEVIIAHTPTVTAVGTLISSARLGSGNNENSNYADQNEWLFKPNTKYLIRTVNRSGQNTKTANFSMQFHELS